MVHPTWTCEDLKALVADKEVLLRGLDASVLPVPKWLGLAALEESSIGVSNSVDQTHPEDRAILIDSFRESVLSPNELLKSRIRIEIDGHWQHREIEWINLVEMPQINGILCTSKQVAGPRISPPPRSPGGVHNATAWMIMNLNHNGLIIDARGAIDDILGLSTAEVVGDNAIDFVHPNSLASAVENWAQLRQNPQATRTARQEWQHINGSSVWLEASFLVRNEFNIELVLIDISEKIKNEQDLEESHARLEFIANHDQLTGLANRTTLLHRLKETIRLNAEDALVVFIDIDRFKIVNDTYGHDVGDTLLVEIANRLKEAVRPNDLAVRYGGDEFVIICDHIPLGDETGFLARLEANVFQEEIHLGPCLWTPEASIGYSRPKPNELPESVLRRADEAMFEIKRQRTEPRA